MAKHLRRRAPALQKPRDLGLRRHDAAFLSRLAFALHGRQARALLVPDQVRAEKAVRAPVSPFLESALKWRPSEAGASGHPPPRLGTGAAGAPISRSAGTGTPGAHRAELEFGAPLVESRCGLAEAFRAFARGRVWSLISRWNLDAHW